MPSTKRYFTLQEAANYFGVPVSQMRRWVKRFLAPPPHKRIRIPVESLAVLEAIYKGFYHRHLRGAALVKYVREQSTLPPTSPYTILQEIRQRLDKLSQCLDQTTP